jgi:hypothetical protein
MERRRPSAKAANRPAVGAASVPEVRACIVATVTSTRSPVGEGEAMAIEVTLLGPAARSLTPTGPDLSNASPNQEMVGRNFNQIGRVG